MRLALSHTCSLIDTRLFLVFFFIIRIPLLISDSPSPDHYHYFDSFHSFIRVSLLRVSDSRPPPHIPFLCIRPFCRHRLSPFLLWWRRLGFIAGRSVVYLRFFCSLQSYYWTTIVFFLYIYFLLFYLDGEYLG
ncbi:hypothetical protein BDV30DRAFT_175287 [Aspergillus minisclerotigenes]|uniref:Uncharacterized protein n=1 Tax=Aspergillus minisclerotigenes TaxID=656917 RepID=A0A5N6IXS7_9EURO|nr:hypothetical protein BDV30DRAFT_175287 [Aspergillus minisclerotigenes]